MSEKVRFYLLVVCCLGWLFMLGIIFPHKAQAQNPWQKQMLSEADTLYQLPHNATIQSIIFLGNYRTKESILKRELDFFVGDTLTPDFINQKMGAAKRKLFNLSLFVEVKAYVLPRATHGSIVPVDVVFELKERWYTFPIPLFELADRNFNEWWSDRHRDMGRINYGINFKQENVRGRNEVLKILVQHGFTPKYEAFYRIPYINRKQRDGLYFGASYSTNRAVAYNSANNRLNFAELPVGTAGRSRFYAVATYNWRIGFFTNHSVEARYFYNTIADTIALLNPNYFYNGKTYQSYFRLSYNFGLDVRDMRYYAARGYVIEGGITNDGLAIAQGVNITTFRGRYARYFDFGRNFFGGFGLQGKASFPADAQPYNLSMALGYLEEMVRGYERYVLDGPHYALGKAEVRYRFFNRTLNLDAGMPIRQFSTLPVQLYITAYTDAGYAYHPQASQLNLHLNNKLALGYGMGLNIVTFYDLVFRMEYSQNVEGTGGFFLNMRAPF